MRKVSIYILPLLTIFVTTILFELFFKTSVQLYRKKILMLSFLDELCVFYHLVSFCLDQLVLWIPAKQETCEFILSWLWNSKIRLAWFF